MRKVILFDIFFFPALFSLIMYVIFINNYNNSTFLIIYIFFLYILLSLIRIGKKDLYVKGYKIDNNILKIEYQKHPFKKKTDILNINTLTLKLIKINSKSFFLEPNVIILKHVDENEYHFKETLKIESNTMFLDLIRKLSNIET